MDKDTSAQTNQAGTSNTSGEQANAGGSTGGTATDDLRQELIGKRCFVIIPYGVKADHDGTERNFDQVFDTLVKPTVEELGLKCKRSIDAASPGLIHKEMTDQILDWELAIVDITTGNPNVFYELGVRHTAKPSGTIIIRHEETMPPFNIGGMRALSYRLDDPTTLAESKSILRDAIIAAMTQRGVDSLVHQMAPGLNISRRSRVLQRRDIARYRLPESLTTRNRALKDKRIGLITGDIVYVDDVDVWVNPENTRMEMARVHDDSVSATIRYYGGKKNARGNLTRDVIGDKLIGKVTKGQIVEATTVVVTGSGLLQKSNGVRRIFHLAAQHGEPGKGYLTVRSIEDCIKSALEEVDLVNQAWRVPIALRLMKPMRSIIFPLFGTRSRDLDHQSVTDALVQSSISYLETWSETKIECVYFLAYTNRDKELCETSFTRLGLKPETS